MPYPINATHKLLLEDNASYLLLEDNTSKLILDETVALDSPLDAATVSGVTPALDFAGEAIPTSNLTYEIEIDPANTFDSQLATPVVVQRPTGADNNGVSGSVSATFGSNNTAGNTIIVCIPVALTSNSGITTPTDTQGNIYTQIGDFTDGTHFVGQRWFIANNIKGGANTVSCNPDPGATNLHVWEVSGLVSSSTLDKSHSSITTTGTSLSSGASATTTVANELVLGVFCVDANDTYIAGGSYTNGTTVANTAFSSFGEELVVSSTGAQTATATASSSTTALSVVMTFKASGTPLLDKTSNINTGFYDSTAGDTTDSKLLLETTNGGGSLLLEDNTSYLILNQSFTSGDYVSYQVPSATLSNATTYYWRVRRDPNGGSYGEWSNIQSFTPQTNVSITQVAATITFSGGTQVIGGPVSASIAQVGATLTFAGGTQTIATSNFVALSQVAATITFAGGTQAIATVNKVAIPQVAATITFAGGTQSVATVRDVAIAQVAATITFGGGTQAVATVNIVAISQSAATITFGGGTQTVASVQKVALAQLAGTITFAGGVQAIATVNNVALSQVAATITFTGGVQVPLSAFSIALSQVAATLTFAGGVQSVKSINIVAWVSPSITVSSGGKSSIINSGSKIDIVQSGGKLSTVTTGTKTDEITSSNKNTTVTSGGSKVVL